MPDKQSAVVVSREKIERAIDAIEQVGYQDKFIDYTLARSVKDELRALLAATPVQAVDVGGPVAYLYSCPEDDCQRPEVRHCYFRIKVISKGWIEEPLYRHSQPPTKPRITMADVMKAFQAGNDTKYMVGTSNWCAHMAEQLNQCSEVATVPEDPPSVSDPHSAKIKGMVPTADGQHAVMIDAENDFYGWTFFKHPYGGWVSSRKATEAEIHAARRASLITPQD